MLAFPLSLLWTQQECRTAARMWEEGMSSVALQPTPVAPVYRAPTDYAIVVGIQHYNGDIPQLQGSNNDADLFRQWLIAPDGGGLDPHNVTYLISAGAPGRPRGEEIENVILQFFDHYNTTGARRGRRLYLYFAGHGVTPAQDPYGVDCALVMGDAVRLALRSMPGRLAATRVRSATLFDEIVLFMDCCREVNGLVVSSCGLPDLRGTSAARLPFIYGLAAAWALTASERLLPHPFDSKEQPLWQGVFTHSLLNGLRSAVNPTSQEVTSGSLKQYVVHAVQALLPQDDNIGPDIQWSETLPEIRFGKGVRVPVSVRTSVPAATVTVLNGGDPSRTIETKDVPDPNGVYVFSLFPGRYIFVARNAAGAEIVSPKVEQILGGQIDVVL